MRFSFAFRVLPVACLSWGIFASPVAAARRPSNLLHAPVRVGSAVRHSLSPRPLRETHADPRGSADAVAPPRRTEPAAPRAAREENALDPVVQRTPGLSAPTELLQFDGASINDDVALFGYGLGITGPNGAVGPDHYFQTISIVFRIFDKSGNLLLGPLPTYTIWTGLGGICETDRPFGPVVKYDALADRWFISQDAFDNDDETRHQCIAVSTSGDPGGTWARYDFVIDPVEFGQWSCLTRFPEPLVDSRPGLCRTLLEDSLETIPGNVLASRGRTKWRKE